MSTHPAATAATRCAASAGVDRSSQASVAASTSAAGASVPTRARSSSSSPDTTPPANAAISSRVASRSRNPHLASNGVSAQISSGLWLASRYTRVGASRGMPRSFSRSKPDAGLLQRRMRLDRQRSGRRQDLHQERQRAEPVGDLAAERGHGVVRDHLIERAAGALDHAGRAGMGTHPEFGLRCAVGRASLELGDERRIAPVVVTDRATQTSDHGAIHAAICTTCRATGDRAARTETTAGCDVGPRRAVTAGPLTCHGPPSGA